MSAPVEHLPGPNIVTERDLPTFDTVEPKAVEWLWPGRIALGKLTLIVGDPGLGKSLIGLALLTHVSKGAPWPVDKSPCELGRAVLISAEDDVNGVSSRCVARDLRGGGRQGVREDERSRIAFS